MSTVLGSDFVITGKWAKLGFLRDNIFELLCLKSTAPT